jgi:hypothetical protein
MKTNNGTPSILVTQVSQYAEDHHAQIDEDLLDEITDELEDYVAGVLACQGSPVNAPSDIASAIGEAVNGNVHIPGYDRMDPQAGPGSVWAAGGISKKGSVLNIPPQVLDTEGNYVPNTTHRSWFKRKDMRARALYGQVEAHIKTGLNGKKIVSITTDKLKVETKKIAHILLGKSRTYSDVPADAFLAKRALEGRFKAGVIAAGTDLFHGVATNPHSSDWTGLAAYLCRFPAQNCSDGDYSNFDRRTEAAILKRVYRMKCNVIARLHPEDPYYKARVAMSHASLFSLSAVDNVVWKSTRGTKSGDVMTTIDNNFANLLNFVYAWRKLTGLSLKKFTENVSILTFGDDVVWNVSDEFIHVFNFKNIQEIFVTLGHEFTPASKDGVQKSGLDQVTFLKRGFKIQPNGMAYAPLDQGSIWAPFTWSQLPPNDYEGWVNTIRAALMEAHVHGSEYYNQCLHRLKEFVYFNKRYFPTLAEEIRGVLGLKYSDFQYEYLSMMGLTQKTIPSATTF